MRSLHEHSRLVSISWIQDETEWSNALERSPLCAWLHPGPISPHPFCTPQAPSDTFNWRIDRVSLRDLVLAPSGTRMSHNDPMNAIETYRRLCTPPTLLLFHLRHHLKWVGCQLGSETANSLSMSVSTMVVAILFKQKSRGRINSGSFFST